MFLELFAKLKRATLTQILNSWNLCKGFSAQLLKIFTTQIGVWQYGHVMPEPGDI
jgi:hypothetical protein